LLVVDFATDMADNALLRSYPDGWWPETQRRLKSAMGWLPFAAPAAPIPPIDGDIMLLDLSKL
jgi:hypothetical protein